MSKQQFRVKVNKVPLENKHYDTSPQVFPSMPRLYLEIIENKAKIKQDLINKEYVPVISSSYAEAAIGSSSSPDFKPSKKKNNYRKEEDFRHEPSSHKVSRSFSENYEDSTSSIDDRDMKDLMDKFKNNSKSRPVDLMSSVSSNDTNDVLRAAKQIEENKSETSSSAGGREFGGSGSKFQENYDDNDDDPNSARLKQLLADTDSEQSSVRGYDKYSRSHEHMKSPPMLNAVGQGQIPPSLAELEAKGMYQKSNELRDIGRVTMSEREEEDLKREYLFKFEILKKKYKEASNIPEYTIHTDLSTLEKSYNATIRSLSLDSSVDYYKKLLIGAFMVIEYALGKWLRLDMEGYTKQQIVSMNSYEQLLIELGEKSYRPAGTGYPVEIRLLGMVIMNTAIFLFTKMVMRNTGSNLLGMLNNMTNTASSQPKRKMRGPDINLNDIPDLDEVSSQVN